MLDFETAKSNLHDLADWFDEEASERDRNEAATRFHIIDRLLKDCLAWQDAEIDVEEHHAGSYSDYELGSPSKLLVVEAKRQGVYFEVPAGFDRQICALSTLTDLNAGIAKAIEQAMLYGQERGIALAAVCNGDQLIAFLASRQDGVPPDQGRALVFVSLREMLEHSVVFWDNLSRPGVVAHNLRRTLGGDTIVPPPEKLSATILDYPGFKNRNPLATELQILGGMVLEDIVKDPEVEEDFLRETYCESGALSQYALVSKEILRARYSAYLERETEVTVEPATTKKGVSPRLRGDIVAASLGKRPILLVGNVGVGKSIFIRHLIRIDAREELSKAIVLYIDFGTKPAIATDLESYVASEIELQLNDQYGLDVRERNFVRGVYNLQLERFGRGVNADLKKADPDEFRRKEVTYLEELMGDQEHHLRTCLQFVAKGQRKQTVIFLDNVDQRPMEFQERVFLIAHAFAENWPVATFISIRPDTFYESRTKGSLSAYQPRVFTIDPPRVDRVLVKRLKFALTQLESTGRLDSFPEGLTLSSDTLGDYLKMMLKAFETNSDTIEFVDNMCGGNIRKALDFVTVFVGSGHVDSTKILDIMSKSGRYDLPLHEFMRAVIFGDHEHFDPVDSPFANVFEVSSRDQREHFLLLAMLAFVERMGNTGTVEGYTDVSALYGFLQGLSFDVNQVKHGLDRSLEKLLLEAPVVTDDGSVRRVRLTSVGAYTLKRLPTLFSYIDAVIVDTPIMDPQFRARIQDVRAIAERLDRAIVFADYVDSAWEASGLAVDSGIDWRRSSRVLRTTIDDIRARLARSSLFGSR